MDLFDLHGQRLYLTAGERQAFMRVACQQVRAVRTFCTVMHDTGCRISEALALTPAHLDVEAQAIIFESLKKRRQGVYRAVPVPSTTLDTLTLAFEPVGGSQAAKKRFSAQPLWSWSRMTAYRRIVAVMKEAGIEAGAHRCPKGLRHGFGVHAIHSGIPLNLLSRWMGHSSLEVTAIYANALGEEERDIASRMWG